MTRTPGTEAWDTTRPYRVFVDESEVGGYSMTAVYVRPADVHRLRSELRGHLKPGQRSIHFTKERPEIRRAVLRAITTMPVRAEIYQVENRTRASRSTCLRAVAMANREGRCQQIVLDQNDSVLNMDRRVLGEVLGHGWGGTYDHLHDHSEPLLWLPDAVSWAWHRGGEWRRALEGLDITVTALGL